MFFNPSSSVGIKNPKVIKRKTHVLSAIPEDAPYPLSMRWNGTVSSMIYGQVLNKAPVPNPNMNLPAHITLKSK